MEEVPKRMLYSMVDAAEMIGVKRSTMYDLAAKGDVRTVKLGRRRLVTAESLEQLVKRLTAVE